MIINRITPFRHAIVLFSLTCSAFVTAFVPPCHHRPSPSKVCATLSPQDELQQRYNSEDGLGDVQIPSTGVSVQDEMESAAKDRFETELVPIVGFQKVAAQLVTTAASTGSFEPVRYLLSLSAVEKNATKKAETESPRSFVLVDVPPFSPALASKIRTFMGNNSRLAAMIVTSRDAIHYDEAPAVYRIRRADLDHWAKAFPGLDIIAYRLDAPRDCRESITQILDGYGPFAFNEETNQFEETGRPLTEDLWDHDVAQDILRGKKAIEDKPLDDNEEYSEEAIRAREENKKILAVYTTGHTYGSVSYIFPETGLCASGYTLPIEDTREDENPGMERTAPMLDCRGYITTNQGGVRKQMESARKLVQKYADRFRAVLPSRGDPLIFRENESEETKKEFLLDVIAQYERIGQIYEDLGIFGDDDE